MISSRAAERYYVSSGADRSADLSFFVILVCLHAGGAFDSIAGFMFPGLVDSTVRTASLVLWLFLYLWSLIALLRQYDVRWLSDISQGTSSFLLIVLIIACLSPLWSLDPSLSTQRIVHLLGTTLIGVFIGYHFGAQKILASLLLALSILIIGGTLAAISLPTLGQSIYEGDAAWHGLQGDKNKFGFAASISAVVTLCRMQSLPPIRWSIVYWGILNVSVVALVMSKSMTSAAALLLAVAVLCFHFMAARTQIPIWATLTLTLASLLLTIVVAAVLGFDRLDQWTGIVGRSSDLTGRTDIWQPVWHLIIEKPVLGYGYGALWFPRSGWEDTQQKLLGLTWTAFHAHNGFLQLASEIGLPAALLSMIFAFVSLAQTLRVFYLRESPYVLFVIAFQVAFLMANTFEALLLIDRNLSWILFVALPLSTLRSYKRLSWPAPCNRLISTEL